MRPVKSKGFTLVELLITLAVFTVLIGLGVPSFLGAIQNTKLNTDYSALISSIYLARSEAVKRSSNVSVCARATDSSCGTDWNNGWVVFIDNTQGGAGSAGVIDAADEILSVSPELDGRTLAVTSSLSPNQSSVGNSAPRTFIRYRPGGSNYWSGGTFVLCDERGKDNALSLNVVLTGDIRKGRQSDNGIARNVHGIEVSCP